MGWLRSIVLRVHGRLGTKSAPDATSASPTEGKNLQLEFWTVFGEFIDDHGSIIKTTKTLSGAWMNISICRSGFQLMAVATVSSRDSQSKDVHHLRSELYIDNTETKKKNSILEKQKQTIETDFGGNLCWYNPQDKRLCGIYVRKTVD